MCYTNALDLAVHHACRSIAFPCISTGAFGFDQRVAADTALTAVRKWLRKKTNNCKLDTIIYCLFTDEDE